MAGTIALWMQAIPTLTRQDVMEALAATAVRKDTSLTYPNNKYGYGEIDARAGLDFLLRRYDGVESVSADTDGTLSAEVYDLTGRCVSASARHGVYISGGRKILR